MEFVLPVVFASGEAMIWVLLIVTLIVVGRGKILPSEKTLVIERQCRYSMVLAPGLNLALPFVEAIAEQIFLCKDAKRDGTLLCFEVRDPHIATRKQPSYLLMISIRNSLLHFETKPVSPQAAFHDAGHTPLCASDKQGTEIENAVHVIGKAWTITLRRIAQPSAAMSA
jgi:hypothetical protein